MSLVRRFATVSGATLASRVLGFGRDIMIAAALGAGPVAEAFFVAFRLPNLFRRLLAEGPFNAAFVPLFARAREEGEERSSRFAAEVFAGLALVLLALTLLAEIGMSLFVLALAPGFADEPDKLALTILLSRLTFPYLAFMSVWAMLAAVLNTLGRFAAAAFAPVLLNVVLIAVLGLVLWQGWEESATAGVWLAGGVFVGGIAQLALVLADLRRVGFSFPLQRPRLTPGVKRFLVLLAPAVLAGGVTQINVFVGTIIASLQDGAISWLYYADRLYQLPLGMVGIGMGVVLLPELSRHLRAGDRRAFLDSQNRALELSMALTLPAAAALLAVPIPIVAVLFERGAFDAADTVAVAAALAGFAAGLPAFVLIKVLSPAFFANENTRTPMLFAGVNLVANVAVSLALFPFFGHVGLAIGTSVAGWTNALLLAGALVSQGDLVLDRRAKKRLPMLLVSSALMAGGLLLLADVLAPWLVSRETHWQALGLMLIVSAGGVSFAVLSLLTGAVDRDLLLRMGRRA